MQSSKIVAFTQEPTVLLAAKNALVSAVPENGAFGGLLERSDRRRTTGLDTWSRVGRMDFALNNMCLCFAKQNLMIR